jgi:hypothetical protein
MWHTLEQMRPRFKMFVLIALLAFTANFGGHVSRVAPLRESNIVVVNRANHERREVAESLSLPASPARRQATTTLIATDAPRATAALDHALFQRPPPSPLSLRL